MEIHFMGLVFWSQEVARDWDLQPFEVFQDPPLDSSTLRLSFSSASSPLCSAHISPHQQRPCSSFIPSSSNERGNLIGSANIHHICLSRTPSPQEDLPSVDSLVSSISCQPEPNQPGGRGGTGGEWLGQNKWKMLGIWTSPSERAVSLGSSWGFRGTDIRVSFTEEKILDFCIARLKFTPV